MLRERIEGNWLAAFRRVLALTGIAPSRPVLVHLSQLAAYDLGASNFQVQMPTPAQSAPVPVKSTGTSWAVAGNRAGTEPLKLVEVVVCTVEGLVPLGGVIGFLLAQRLKASAPPRASPGWG